MGPDVEAQFHSAISNPRPGDSAEAHWTFHVTCPICTTKRQIANVDIPKGLQFELKNAYERHADYRVQGR